MSTNLNTLPSSHRNIYILFLVIWLILAINPQFRKDWLLENILVFIVFPTIIWLDKKYKFSTFALILIFIFGTLHLIGAHFTYSKMYHFNHITNLFGFERNHYDRVVHFLFGLFIYVPICEILLNYFTKKSASNISILAIIAIATIYEELEWLAVELFYKDLGIAFLGIQGDIWDAQKDIALAILGAIISSIIIKNKNSLQIT